MESLEKGVNTGASWEDLTGPPPVEVGDTAAATAEAVESGAENSAEEEQDTWPWVSLRAAPTSILPIKDFETCEALRTNTDMAYPVT